MVERPPPKRSYHFGRTTLHRGSLHNPTQTQKEAPSQHALTSESYDIQHDIHIPENPGGTHESNPGLKDCVAVAGVLFLASAYPLAIFIRQEPALSMMFSLYVTLGIFLLLAIPNPPASRSLIAFTAWSSLAHAAIMGTQALRNMIPRGELIGVAVLVIIGAALIALAPAKQPAQSA